MARMIKHFPPRRQKYPWNKWTNGKKWQAKHGSDFLCDPESFRRYVVLVAYRYGLKVTTRVSGDTVTFQFSTRP